MRKKKRWPFEMQNQERRRAQKKSSRDNKQGKQLSKRNGIKTRLITSMKSRNKMKSSTMLTSIRTICSSWRNKRNKNWNVKHHLASSKSTQLICSIRATCKKTIRSMLSNAYMRRQTDGKKIVRT